MPTSSDQTADARAFARLHVPGDPLVLPNAWDAASARIVAAAGARAVATTSAGVAWSLGATDGEGVTRSLALEAVARIVHAVDLPVTADIERGFGDGPSDVGDTVAWSIASGVVGVNLEDSLRPIDEQVLRLQAARAAADDAGIPLFINARIDTHRLPDTAWLDETVARARAYTAAGASGVFVLGALRAEAVRALVTAVDVPVNVAYGPGTLSVHELAAAGAARISAGSSIAEAAYGLVGDLAGAMLDPAGTATATAPTVSYSELNRILG